MKIALRIAGIVALLLPLMAKPSIYMYWEHTQRGTVAVSAVQERGYALLGDAVVSG